MEDFLTNTTNVKIVLKIQIFRQPWHLRTHRWSRSSWASSAGSWWTWRPARPAASRWPCPGRAASRPGWPPAACARPPSASARTPPPPSRTPSRTCPTSPCAVRSQTRLKLFYNKLHKTHAFKTLNIFRSILFSRVQW